MSEAPFSDRYLRMPDLVAKVRISRATINRAIAAGTFPAPRQIGANAVAWLESEVDAWMKARPVAPRQGRAA